MFAILFRSFGFLVPKYFNYLAFKYFGFERTLVNVLTDLLNNITRDAILRFLKGLKLYNKRENCVLFQLF